METKFFIFWIIILFNLSCSSSDNDSEIIDNQEIKPYRPVNFPSLRYNFNKNPTTKYGILLGRNLFYEGKLSSDGATDCASCHIQQNAFTHHGHTLSHGVFNRVGFRNAPAIQNLAFLSNFNWDGAITDLDKQPIVPITSHQEMDENFPSIMSKLEKEQKYIDLFKKAFGSNEITAEKILFALSQFMTTMVSSNSKYDKFIRGENQNFSLEEKEGMNLFQQKCSSCHSGELFTDESFRNNGLYLNIDDLGRYRVTALDSDKGKFRVPSLRNVELTAPYMHDGRFYTLESVLNHYSDGVENLPNLDSSLKNNSKLGIELTPQEKNKIISFLKTLTDNDFITNSNFSAP